MKTLTIKCQHAKCGKTFSTIHGTKLYCSRRCRLAAKKPAVQSKIHKGGTMPPLNEHKNEVLYLLKEGVGTKKIGKMYGCIAQRGGPVS